MPMKVIYLLFCSVSLLSGQVAEPVHYLNEEALLEADGLEDIETYLWSRTKRIQTEAGTIFAKPNKNLLKGFDFSGSNRLVSGAVHPHLLRAEVCLSTVMSVASDPVAWQTIAGNLYQRGLAPKEIKMLADALNVHDMQEHWRKSFAELDKWLLRLEMEPPKNLSDSEIKAYLTACERMEVENEIAWAVKVLEPLPVKSRRIILSYVFEGISGHWERLPLTEVSPDRVQEFKKHLFVQFKERTAQ